MKTNIIYNEDCVEGMKKLPDESVDLIITSPPYNLGKTHNTFNSVFKPYDCYVDEVPESEYQEWQLSVLGECYRVLKRNGSMWYNHKNRIRGGVQITPYEWLLKSEFLIKQEVVWQNGSHSFGKVRFYPMTERVYWLVKDPQTVMNNIIGKNDVFTRKNWKPVGTDGVHKRAFPEKLVTDILACFEDKQIVLDPFMGSGTTAVACVNMGRKYIGFELSEEYHKLAVERVSAHENQMSLFREY